MDRKLLIVASCVVAGLLGTSVFEREKCAHAHHKMHDAMMMASLRRDEHYHHHHQEDSQSIIAFNKGGGGGDAILV